MHRVLCFLLAFFFMGGTAWAGTITAYGSVTALDDINQMIEIDGTADFDGGTDGANIPLNLYAGQGLTYFTGALSGVCAGALGTASQPRYDINSYYPAPIAGGGTAASTSGQYTGVATFSTTVTQVGLTASQNGTQYLTVWDTSCNMIGQVRWVPSGDSAFIGLDTGGVPIYMVSYGNDDMWNGATYGIGGSTIFSDTWVWGSGTCGSSSITAVGAVTALTAYGEMSVVDGMAEFDEGPTSGGVPLTTYASQGMTFHTGALTSVLSGVTTGGNASQPQYNDLTWFTQPPCGAGWATGVANRYAGVATFSGFVTQVGLTASRNGNQYLTAWDTSGSMIGQINWVPSSESSFLGLDTGGVAIGMVAYGNDDLWAGGTYGIGGSTIFSDSWVWGGYCTANSQCDDGDVCNGTETCSAGSCVSGSALVCNDSNVCTDDSCHTTNGCTYVNNTNSCDDGTVCTTGDVCSGGTCSGTAIVCNDSDVCTDDSCHPTNGCTYVNNTASCDDSDACTTNDVCSGGTCAGSTLNCDDNNVCTDDSCHQTNGCEYANNTASCDDSSVCTTGDVCAGGTCGGTAVDCDDTNECTDDTCDPTNGCQYANNTASCDDGDSCTETDACVAGICGGAPVDCDDGNICTDDTCDATNGCTNTAIAGCCLTDTDCDPGSTCDTNTHLCVPDGAGGAGGSTSGTGGTTSTSGTGGASSSGDSGGDTEDSGGCGCQTPGSSPVAPNAAWLALLGLGMLSLRRRRSA